MTKEEIKALPLTSDQQEAAKRLYTAQARFKKDTCALDNLTTQEEVIKVLNDNIRTYYYKRGFSPSSAEVVNPDEILRIVYDAVDAGVNYGSIITKLKSFVKIKINNNIDKQINELQAKINELQSNKID